MSLFRRERIFASVEIDRVVLVRLGVDGAALDEAVIALSLDPEQPAEALRAVGAALAAPAWSGTARSVVLSDRLVRYLVVRRPDGVRSRAELRLACEARVQSSFERPASEWEHRSASSMTALWSATSRATCSRRVSAPPRRHCAHDVCEPR